MSSIERRAVNLPEGFDPDKHHRALLTLITKQYGAGWEIDSINMVTGSASISRHAAITEVTESNQGDSFEVRLKAGTKPSDGDRAAAKFEDQYPGFYMTKFEPFLGKATLSKLTDDEARCRGAVAVALGVKPWDVRVAGRKDGGYDLGLPRSYSPSKADKLEQVATEVVGRPGWYAKIDAQRLIASLIPADPPTFPPAISFPLDRLGKGDVMDTPFGHRLSEPGERPGNEISIDWRASGSALVSGLAGGGKAQPLDAPIPVPVSEKFPTGWATMGDLEVDDEVYSRDGSITRVTYLSPIRERSVLALELSDGQVVEADSEHLWLVSDQDETAVDLNLESVTDAAGLLDQAKAAVGLAGDVEAIAAHLGVAVADVRRFVERVLLPEAGRRNDRPLYPAAEVAYGLHRFAAAGELHKIVTSSEVAETLTAADGSLRWLIASGGHESSSRVPLYVTDVREVGVKPVRCLAVEHPEHTYLTAGFVPTHNTVTITALLADRVANGARLAVIDTKDKCVDYQAFKDMCAFESTHDGKITPAWGCDSLGAAVAVLALLCKEGEARARKLGKLGINNWLNLPANEKFDPIFIIADEYEALVTRVPEPKALPKDHPIRVEAMQENMAHDLIAHFMNRIVKEFRFVGLHPLISTQVSNASTGLPPSLKGKMGHFVLCGSTPSEAARKQSFPDASGVPQVPANVASGGAVARGTGSAKIEGAGAYVFKSYFASVDDYQAKLHQLGVKRYTERQVTPSQFQIDTYLPSLTEDQDEPRRSGGTSSAGGGDRGPSGRSAAEIAASMGDTVGQAMHDGSLGTGFERANNMRHLAGANAGKATGRQKKEAAEEAAYAAQSGEVTVRHVEPRSPTADQGGDDW